MADRRAFLEGSLYGAALTAAILPTTKGEAWRVFVRGPGPEITFRCRVYDAATGKDVSRQFPIRNMRRLRRSLEKGEPRLMVLFKLNEKGDVYFEGEENATEPALVQVVRLEQV
jgi:hypothetical protein